MAALRGICEDYLALRFMGLLSLVDRNRASLLIAQEAFAEAISAQGNFFELNRPWQPVLRPSDLEPSQGREEEIRAIAARHGWTGRRPWPSVWFMAKACSEESLYGYLYSATSALVHFSPSVLLRMGWGGDKDNFSDSTECVFTTSNFEKYYADFNRTYSLYLLHRMLLGPAASLVPSHSRGLVDALGDGLREQLRWPEVVTFEEMNLDPPGVILRTALKLTHKDVPGKGT